MALATPGIILLMDSWHCHLVICMFLLLRQCFLISRVSILLMFSTIKPQLVVIKLLSPVWLVVFWLILSSMKLVMGIGGEFLPVVMALLCVLIVY